MSSKRPNIFIIFTDQQRADTVGVRNPVMRTPVMDRLCAEGTLFTNAHTASPVCVPARCATIFGQYPHRTGCCDTRFPMPEATPDRPTFMQLLTESGYRTHGVGKMHFMPDLFALRGLESRVVSEDIPGTVESDDYHVWLREKGFGHVHDPFGVRGEMYYIPQPSQLPPWAHNSHWIADRSIDFLRTRDRSRPFLLWSSFIHPHPPFSPPVPWNKLYRAPSMPSPKRPPGMHNLHTFINRVQNRYKYRDAGTDDNLLRAMKAYYYGATSFIDYNVGRILEVLAELGELDDTLILWTADHGEFLGDYGCFGKRSFMGAAANIPLFVRYPYRFPAGRRVESPASLVDVMPTVLAAAGEDSGGLALHGVDLARLAGGSSDREMVFGQYQLGNRAAYMALTTKWKYIYVASDNREYLFDLLVDPDETRNRAETLGYLSRTRTMREALIGFLSDEGYTDPLEGDSWRVYPAPEFPADPDTGLLFQDPAWAHARTQIPVYTDETYLEDYREEMRESGKHFSPLI